MHPLAPTGPLRAGLVEAPTAGVFFIAVSPRPHGVTLALAQALAAHLGLALQTAVFPDSGACTEALHRAEVDVAFMPADAHRRTRVAFGPAYYLLESTYLAAAASDIHVLGDVDRPHIRVIGVADTTTIRAATASLRHTTPRAIPGVSAAIAAFRDHQADALALSRDSLAQLQPSLPGSRITPGGFQHTTINIAVPPGRPDALAAAAAFLERAKQDGTVRRALDAVGLPDEQVAPPEFQP